MDYNRLNVVLTKEFWLSECISLIDGNISDRSLEELGISEYLRRYIENYGDLFESKRNLQIVVNEISKSFNYFEPEKILINYEKIDRFLNLISSFGEGQYWCINRLMKIINDIYSYTFNNQDANNKILSKVLKKCILILNHNFRILRLNNPKYLKITSFETIPSEILLFEDYLNIIYDFSKLQKIGLDVLAQILNTLIQFEYDRISFIEDNTFLEPFFIDKIFSDDELYSVVIESFLNSENIEAYNNFVFSLALNKNYKDKFLEFVNSAGVSEKPLIETKHETIQIKITNYKGKSINTMRFVKDLVRITYLFMQVSYNVQGSHK
ncbi:hypothetical protein [Emticicia sp. 21SJ11W-3]|uniref:hypothetical protein n=1 Tax=Emticicia sp. 21SJ11W-3 TaxID=2916755 RepID=UPI00209F1DEF|nr:hypothetical protein [Emticicia sp. 21SJ11W-3]UTA66966.1 hypothetical protein MB380_15310 [Emticicia sp. 21SJ11W-3]